jgi:type II restriction/modification system DNA methylase subunit YeeA
MNAAEFVRKWAAARGAERQHSQEHFLDICHLLGEKTPAQADPSGNFYTFEKGARAPGGNGFADVWLKGHFAWEYKGRRNDLAAAYTQVLRYHEALGSPPLLVVCDFDRFEVHTKWTNTEAWVYSFRNEDLLSDDPVAVTTVSGPARGAPKLSAIQVLRALFVNPDELKPQRTTEQITKDAARLFGQIAAELTKWGVDEMRIARFITRVLFCMFATDVGLLPKDSFSRIVNHPDSRADNATFRRHLRRLFGVMNDGGEFGIDRIPHFNGRLFEDDDVPEEVTTQQILLLAELDALNWADVEPSIFGTLFERVLDPKMRMKLGAHYTSRADIELIVEPVLMEPLRREWEQVKQTVEDYLYSEEIKQVARDPLPSPAATPGRASVWTGEGQTPQASGVRADHVRLALTAFRDRLANIRILDPACGSGNFLYVALASLKALEKEVIAFAAVHEVTDLKPKVHPQQLFGLEINHYAVELASIVIWIGYLQWKHRNALPLDDEEPILQPLDQITLQDAILALPSPAPAANSPLSRRSGRGPDAAGVGGEGAPSEPEWPAVDVIIGNPPFLGGKLLRRNLGDDYVDRLFAVYDGRVARESDLCCYWFEKARAAIETGRAKSAGLLATQGIRGGASRRVLERIKQSGDIFYAQADRKWIQDGVAVRVSMVGFDDGSERRRRLNDVPDDNPIGALDRALPVEGINANLTSRSDLTQARRLKENLGISFMGDTKVGPFDIPESMARQLLAMPNPHGKPNSDVVRPWVNGLDITRRPRNMWIIDFPPGTTEQEAALYEAPFAYIEFNVRPMRAVAKSGDATGVPWWIHQRPRPDMRKALAPLARFCVTPGVTKHRVFVWLTARVLPDHRLSVFARDDDYFFGILHSKAHEAWSLATSSRHGVGNDPVYNNTTCFETFPFPEPTDDRRAAIAQAACELNQLRENWLNPEPVDGLPLPEKELKKRTLTNLYNDRPTWLANAHAKLDAAVFAAYGWPETPDQLSDEEILARLLKLNLEREPA